MKQCYCLKCRKLVDPVITEHNASIVFLGEVFTDFPELYAQCPACAEGFIIAESHDVNLKNLQAMYRDRIKKEG